MKNVYLLIFVLLGMAPATFSQISSTAVGGDWSSAATWDGGIVPTNSDDVIIVDGAIVTIDADANAQILTVGQGTSGILQFEPFNSRTLTVGGDVTINTGGIFRSSTTGTETGHVLSVAGNLINNGSLNFSTNGNTAGAGIIFTGASNASFGGNGVTTDISSIIIDKGSDASSVLELNTDNFSFQNSTSTAGAIQSFLEIINGTFKISGMFTMDNGLFAGTGDYTIPETGGLWLNNPNFTVNARAGTANVDGTLQIDAGTLNIGTAANNRLGYLTGSVIIINGGTINLASRFSASTTFGVNYTQTGGVFNVNTVGNTSGTRASFDIQDFGDNASFTMSGGTIVIQNPGIGGSGPRDYFNDAPNVNITGGTLQIGNAFTGGAQTFFLAGKTPGITIDNTAGGHTVQLSGDVSTYGSTTINPGTTLVLQDDEANGHSFLELGSNFINSGALNGTAPGSLLFFSGNAAQTYGGDGVLTGPLTNLVINNAAGLTITNTVASDITVSELSMLSGDIVTGVSTLAVGTSTASLGIFNYASGTIVGKFKRWVDAATGNTDFPVGIAGATRTASIDFTTAPSAGGTLTASWVPAYGGTNGLPLTEPGYPAITDVAGDGYWTITAADGFADGVYTGTFTGTNVTTVTDFSQLVLVKRADEASPWGLDGTHIETTGSNITPVLSRTGMAGFSDFGIGGSLTSLPVAIEYFKGSKQGSGNLLDWKISCINSPTATMLLERSSDARKFSSISNITATALRCLQPFSYTDASAGAGINYYRIKVTDADGKSTYSNIIALLNKEKGFDIVSMMPNPVQTTTTLSIASAVASKMEIVVTDIAGKKVAGRTVSLVAGSNQVVLDFTAIANGAYQITGYSSAGGSKTLRFIKN